MLNMTAFPRRGLSGRTLPMLSAMRYGGIEAKVPVFAAGAAAPVML